MGAGLSKAQIDGRIYSRLSSMKRDLQRAGVSVSYRRQQLFLNDVANVGGGFNVSFKVSRASNGETFGAPIITIHPPDPMLEHEVFGGWCTDKQNGTFDQGVARLKQLFKTPTTEVL
jgi:hypothetical protein